MEILKNKKKLKEEISIIDQSIVLNHSHVRLYKTSRVNWLQHKVEIEKYILVKRNLFQTTKKIFKMLPFVCFYYCIIAYFLITYFP